MNQEQASFSLAVPGPLGGGRVFLFAYAARTYDEFRAPSEGAGHFIRTLLNAGVPVLFAKAEVREAIPKLLASLSLLRSLT
jgi:hypothetical protein